MEKVDHISPPLELDGLAKKEEEEEVAVVIKGVRLDLKEIEDLRSEIEEEEKKEIEEEIEEEDQVDEAKEEDEDVYKDLLLHPQVSSWIKDGETVHGIQVMHVPLSTNSKRIEFDLCPICIKPWNEKTHQISCLPCGHIFGFLCIQQWLQTNLCGTCPQCKALCSLKDVRLLNATCLCIPAADKGVADPEISTRRFSFTRQGLIKFRMLESGRRNFALKKRSDAKKRRADVVGRANDLMKRRTELLDRRASVLNRAKALEKKGGSMRLRADALRLRADALGRWADEYLGRAKACEERAKALGQRARAYNQRVKAFEARLFFFRQSYTNYYSNS